LLCLLGRLRRKWLSKGRGGEVGNSSLYIPRAEGLCASANSQAGKNHSRHLFHPIFVDVVVLAMNTGIDAVAPAHFALQLPTLWRCGVAKGMVWARSCLFRGEGPSTVCT
jgi:hypothetical protein